MRIWLSIGLVSFLAAPGTAQQPIAAEMQQAVALPPYAAGAYRRCEVAFVGDDPQRDAVVLVDRGGQLDVCYLPDPADVSLLVPVAAAVRDLALLPGAADNGRDVILVLRADGLHWFECGVGEQTPSEVVGRHDATWSSCDRIWTAPDAAGATWLFGSSNTSATIRRAHWAGSWVAGAPIVALPGATQVLTIDWDGVGTREVVLRFDDLVYVLPWEGLPFWFFQFPPVPPGGRSLLGVVPAGGGEPELLAAFGWVNGGAGLPLSEYVLLVQRADVAQLISFGGVAAASMATADMDGDGRVDLLLGDAGTSRVHLVRRLSMSAGGDGDGGGGGLPMARAGHYALVAGVHRPAGAVDALAVADFDGDGDADLVGLQSAHGLHHFVAGAAAPSRRLQQLSIEHDPQQAHTTVDATGWSLHLPVSVELPAGWAAELANGESMVVQLRGWLQPSPTSFIEPVARIRDVQLPVAASDVEAATVIDLAVEDLDPSAWSMWIHARFVVVGPTGSRRLPSLLLHFTPSPHEASLRAAQVGADLHGEESGKDGGDGNTLRGGELNRDPGDPPVLGPTSP